MKCERHDECNRDEYWRGLCLAHLKASLRPQEEEVEVDDDLDTDSRTSDKEEE